MKILIIHPWIRLGGAELIVIHLANQLEAMGHDVRIATTFVDTTGLPPEAKSLTYLTPPKQLAQKCQKNRAFFLIFGFWLLLAVTWKASIGVDLLNPHNFPASWIAAIIGRIRGIQCIWTCNEPPERPDLTDAFKVGLGDYIGWGIASSPVDKFLVRTMDAIYVPSEMTGRRVRELYNLPSAVIRLGVDSDFYGTEFLESSKWENYNDMYVLLSVGRLHPQKNQVVCIEALNMILPQIPNAILLLAGEGPMLSEWQHYAKELGVDDRVEFLGSVPGKKVRLLYNACDVNLFPATNQSWGLTPFEALLAGKVSIVSQDCGAAEVVGKERIGAVVEPTSAAFAKGIIWLHRDPDRYKRMSERGKSYVSQNLTWQLYSEKVVRLIAHIRSNSRSSIPEGFRPEEIIP